jgi:hypothetical protein
LLVMWLDESFEPRVEFRNRFHVVHSWKLPLCESSNELVFRMAEFLDYKKSFLKL